MGQTWFYNSTTGRWTHRLTNPMYCLTPSFKKVVVDLEKIRGRLRSAKPSARSCTFTLDEGCAIYTGFIVVPLQLAQRYFGKKLTFSAKIGPCLSHGWMNGIDEFTICSDFGDPADPQWWETRVKSKHIIRIAASKTPDWFESGGFGRPQINSQLPGTFLGG